MPITLKTAEFVCRPSWLSGISDMSVIPSNADAAYSVKMKLHLIKMPNNVLTEEAASRRCF
jgi:hypothetical protein